MNFVRHTAYAGVPTGVETPPFESVTHIVADANQNLVISSFQTLLFDTVIDTLGEFVTTPTDSYFSPLNDGWYRLYGSLAFDGIDVATQGIYIVRILDNGTIIADFNENPGFFPYYVVTTEFYYNFYLLVGQTIRLEATALFETGTPVFAGFGPPKSRWCIDRMDG